MTATGFGLLWFFIYGSYALAFWYGVKLVLEQKGDPDATYDPATMVTVRLPNYSKHYAYIVNMI